MNTVNAVDLQEGFEMVDETAKQLRDVVGMQVGDVPALIHQAADHIDALAAKLKDVEAELAAISSAPNRHAYKIGVIAGKAMNERRAEAAEVALAEFHATGGKTMAQVRAEIEGGDVLDDPRVKALVEKAQAVIDRWESPSWKDLQPTGQSIYDMRAALSAIEKEAP